jgi:hypothetical protein
LSILEKSVSKKSTSQIFELKCSIERIKKKSTFVFPFFPEFVPYFQNFEYSGYPPRPSAQVQTFNGNQQSSTINLQGVDSEDWRTSRFSQFENRNQNSNIKKNEWNGWWQKPNVRQNCWQDNNKRVDRDGWVERSGWVDRNAKQNQDELRSKLRNDKSDDHNRGHWHDSNHSNNYDKVRQWVQVDKPYSQRWERSNYSENRYSDKGFFVDPQTGWVDYTRGKWDPPSAPSLQLNQLSQFQPWPQIQTQNHPHSLQYHTPGQVPTTQTTTPVHTSPAETKNSKYNPGKVVKQIAPVVKTRRRLPPVPMELPQPTVKVDPLSFSEENDEDCKLFMRNFDAMFGQKLEKNSGLSGISDFFVYETPEVQPETMTFTCSVRTLSKRVEKI